MTANRSGWVETPVHHATRFGQTAGVRKCKSFCPGFATESEAKEAAAIQEKSEAEEAGTEVKAPGETTRSLGWCRGMTNEGWLLYQKQQVEKAARDTLLAQVFSRDVDVEDV